MKRILGSRLILAGMLTLGWAALISWASVEVTRWVLEDSARKLLSLEAQRRGFEVTSQTLNGNVMGSAANLGLVNLAVKGVALGTLDPASSLVVDTLGAVGRLYDASGVFVVGRLGVILASWDNSGKTSVGLDVGFRPYFQIAMKGQQNVYAAVSLATGQRALYFAAPLYSKVSLEAPVVGASVARLNLDRVDTVLKGWRGHALLVSPQNIVFASDQDSWVGRLTTRATPVQLQAIRELKQFGAQFDTGSPEVLAMDLTRSTTIVEGQRYAVARSPVPWNDPAGPWTLVLLDDLGQALTPALQNTIALTVAALVLLIGLLVLEWLRRLSRANDSRHKAEADLLVYSQKLEADSERKSYLVEVSADLHRAKTGEEFARTLFHHVTPRLGADYGALYVLDEDSGTLVAKGGHGVVVENLPPYEVGQGLVGQCAKERRVLAVTSSGDFRARVVWGGGEEELTCVSLWPIEQLGHLLGVLVLASQTPLRDDKTALVEALLPLAAMNLEILGRNAKTQWLLQESQRQTIERNIQQSTVSALLNAIPDLIWYKNPEGVYLGCNEAYAALVGRPVDLIVGKTDADLYPREVADYYRSDDAATMESSESRSQEEWVDFADGRHLLLDTLKSSFRDSTGGLLGVLSISRDITERQKAQEAMERERAKLQEILDASPLGVGITVGGVARMLNPMIQTMIDAEVGRSISETYVDPSERDKIVAQLKQQRVIRDVEVSMYNRERQARTMRVTFMRIDYENDSGVLVWMLDVTRTKTRKGVNHGKA